MGKGTLELHKDVHLGKKAATYSTKDFRFDDFLTLHAHAEIPEAPVGYGHDKGIAVWGMLGNDRAGDCVWAGGAHETMMWNLAAGKNVTFTDECVLSDYSRVTGYDPITGRNDNGTDMRTAMSYRRKTGLLDANGKRHKIGAFLALEPGNYQQMLQALYFCEAVGIGIEFPASAMDQFNAHKPWTVVKGSSIEGGHYIPVVARPKSTYDTIVTWAAEQLMSNAFYKKYNDESYAIVSQEMLTSGRSIEGFDLAGLAAELKGL